MHDAEKALLFLAPLVLAKFAQQRQQAAPAPAATGTTGATGATGATDAAGAAPATPQADGDSALGKVIGAVEKIFHR